MEVQYDSGRADQAEEEKRRALEGEVWSLEESLDGVVFGARGRRRRS